MTAPHLAEDRGATVPTAQVLLAADGKHFSIDLPNVVKPYEFVLEFNDRDNVKGKRRLRVQPIDDRPPEVLDVELDAVLRKPRFRSDTGRAHVGADGFLVTPDALLPFKGTLRDDYGLTRASWVHEVERAQFELIGQALGDKADKMPMLLFEGSTRLAVALVASYFQVVPGTPAFSFWAPAYWTFMTGALKTDLAMKHSEGEGRIPLESFERVMEGRSIDDLSQNAPGTADQGSCRRAAAPAQGPGRENDLRAFKES